MASSNLTQEIFDGLVPPVQKARAYADQLAERLASNTAAAEAIAVGNETTGAWFMHLELTVEPGQAKAGALALTLKGRLAEAKVIVDNYPGILSWKVTASGGKASIEAGIIDFAGPGEAQSPESLADELTRKVLLVAPQEAPAGKEESAEKAA